MYLEPGRPAGWRVAWAKRRNRVLASARFQALVARIPVFRGMARLRARQLFDLLAGFTYSQTLLAVVESELLALLAEGPCDLATVCANTQLSEDAGRQLLRAAVALDLAEEVSTGWWMLGQQGAALSSNSGALAMIRHHKLLYADLCDPLALLRSNRTAQTGLAQFWDYAGAAPDCGAKAQHAARYSQLMAASQHLVADQVLGAYNFSRHRQVLDVGGGNGAFLGALAAQYPALDLALFDLPQVARCAVQSPHLSSHEARLTVHAGDFLADPLPPGSDLITLIRILHDHDDAPAHRLLISIRRSLAPGARLLIAEPMADTAGAKAMGDAYFGFYLWAMRSGRPRKACEIIAMLHQAGFEDARVIATDQPIAASVIVAFA